MLGDLVIGKFGLFQAKVWLKTKIMNNQLLTAEVFYRPYGKGKTQAEVKLSFMS